MKEWHWIARKERSMTKRYVRFGCSLEQDAEMNKTQRNIGCQISFVQLRIFHPNKQKARGNFWGCEIRNKLKFHCSDKIYKCDNFKFKSSPFFTRKFQSFFVNFQGRFIKYFFLGFSTPNSGFCIKLTSWNTQKFPG